MWRLTISSQKFQILKNILNYSFIFVELVSTLNENQIICFPRKHLFQILI